MLAPDDRLLEGHNLTVVLEPDTDNPALGLAMDPYLENYPLPFLCSDGTHVMGATRQSTRPYVATNGQSLTTGFLYVDGYPFYVNYRVQPSTTLDEEATELHLLGIDAYHRAEFSYRASGDLIWQMGRDAASESSTVRESLNAGNSHFVVFRDRFGYLRSYPVDLLFAFHNDAPFQVLTEAMLLPSLFLDPKNIYDTLANNFGDFDFVRQQRFALKIRTHQYSTFYKIFSDGQVSEGDGLDTYQTSELRLFAYSSKVRT